MRTESRVGDFQQANFVIKSFEDVLEATLQAFAPIYRRLEGAGVIGIDQLPGADEIITRGTRAYAEMRAQEVITIRGATSLLD